MLNDELADLAIFAAVAGYAPQMGDPSAHHQQQMIGLGQQAIPQKHVTSIVRAGSAMRAATAGRVLPAGGHSDVQLNRVNPSDADPRPARSATRSAQVLPRSVARNAWPALP